MKISVGSSMVTEVYCYVRKPVAAVHFLDLA